tara:strand:- start:1546 stop:1743 length:198 start_codon:yes stop_codon:yes gene_type:complete
MLCDPLVLLVMQADGVSEAQLRNLYSGSCTGQAESNELGLRREPVTQKAKTSIRAAENEGMPVST